MQLRYLVLPAILCISCSGEKEKITIRTQPSGSVRMKVNDALKVYFQAPDKHVALLDGQRITVKKREETDKDSTYPYYCVLRPYIPGTFTFTITAEDVCESLVVVVID